MWAKGGACQPGQMTRAGLVIHFGPNTQKPGFNPRGGERTAHCCRGANFLCKKFSVPVLQGTCPAPARSVDARQQAPRLALNAPVEFQRDQGRGQGRRRHRQIADQLVFGQRAGAQPGEDLTVN